MTPFRISLLSTLVLAGLGLVACNKTTETTKEITTETKTETQAATPLPAPPAATQLPMAPNATVMTAQLTGANEVPPVVTEAAGSLEASLTPGSLVLTWTFNYSGLSGPLTGAHFHGPAAGGQNAAVAVPITGTLDSPVTGSVTLTASQAAELTSGNWYLNLHTAAHPDGEIRGQVRVRP